MFERTKHFTHWAIVMHLLFLMFPNYVPNTFLLSLVVLIGSEIIRYWIIKDTHVIRRNRQYKSAFRTTHFWIHWFPCLLILIYSRCYLHSQCIDLFHVNSILIPLMLYLTYMEFDFKRILYHYQYPTASMDSYRKK